MGTVEQGILESQQSGLGSTSPGATHWGVNSALRPWGDRMWLYKLEIWSDVWTHFLGALWPRQVTLLI